jgi:non-ribosomal peptide synthetase component F
LLAKLDSSPEAPVHQISVLPEDKLHQLTAFNSAPLAYPTGTIHEAFERQAFQTPGAIAVTSTGEAITYSELNQKAENLANTLASNGVTSQQVVGVLLPRSTSTVVAALAILKLGAIYLPLDPAYPPQRIAHMVEDSGCHLVLVNDATESLAPASSKCLSVDSTEAALPRAPHNVNSADAAYIIYTSGSTGKPKAPAAAERCNCGDCQ